MKLETHPLIVNVIFFFQPVDNALADIAKGSDVIGEYFDGDVHLHPYKIRIVINNFNIPAFFLISR